MRPSKLGALVLVASLAGCAGETRFPLRAPLLRDTDLLAVRARCHEAPTPEDPKHVSCAPEAYESPLYWDGADNLVFRPLSSSLALETSGESIDVNALDEVPDSAWFTNRPPPSDLATLARGGCSPEQLLDPARAEDGSWVIDKGKNEGSTPGFRVSVPHQGKYLFKADTLDAQPERASAASAIGAAVYHAAGYYAACEQIVYVRPSIFRLKPGLVSRANFSDIVPLDAARLAWIFSNSAKRDGLVRMSASAWLQGHPIGPFRYEGTRSDDPNDVIPHEDRRELRAAKVLAAWIGRFDAREENSLDTWMTEARGGPPDASPGKVLHYQLDASEALGAEWAWPPISRRLGKSYIIDWGDIAHDYVTLGAEVRSWENVKRTPGQEIFGFFDVATFTPDAWKPEYPNAAFSRMTERDAAWMARILARLSPDVVRGLAAMGDFSRPENTAYLAGVLEGRLQKILVRYLTRLSPIADVHVEGRERLCGVDFAEARGVRPTMAFTYRARWSQGGLVVVRRAGGGVCVTLPRVADDGGEPDGAASRYLRVVLGDGVATGPLVAHLYDLGPTRGYRLVGLERPAEDDAAR